MGWSVNNITKDDKKNESVMIRVPRNIANIIDTCVGNTHSSRPDYVIDGIRAFLRYIADCEKDTLDYISEKEDAERSVKIEFYRESMRSMTQIYKDEFNAAKSSDRDVDILLSLPSKLSLEINLTVERTGCFRNRQELIKSAIVYLSVRIKSTTDNVVKTLEFLRSNQSTEDLREQIRKMKAQS